MRVVRQRFTLIVTMVALSASAYAQHRNWKTPAGNRAYAGAWKSKTPGKLHWLLMFPEAPTPAQIAELQDHGAIVAGRAPDFGLIVRASADLDTSSLPLVSVEALGPDFKISGELNADSGPSGYHVVEFYPDVDPDTARQILNEAQVQLLDHPSLLPNQYLIQADDSQLAELAAWDEVAYIFPASSDLVQGNAVNACPGAVVGDGFFLGQYVKAGGAWSQLSDGTIPLGYYFAGITSQLPASSVRSEVLRAFGEWAQYVKLSFGPATAAASPRTISILFAKGAHGDPYPFDGPGKVLAHTFYPAPMNTEPIAGDMHFDDAEAWKIGGDIDLFSVALHEAGHALGLAHSDRPGAVMYPYYRRLTQLSTDDIAGIQDIYKDKPVSNPAPQPALAIRIVDPSGPATTTAAAMAVLGSASNVSGALRVSWVTDRNASGRATVTGTNWSIAAVPLSPGDSVLTVTGTDASGKNATASVRITRQAPPPAPDKIAPQLQITTPGGTITSTTAAYYTLRGAASDNVGVTAVTWTNSTGGNGSASGLTNWTAEVPLKIGNNLVTIRAYDAAGNSSWRTATIVRR